MKLSLRGKNLTIFDGDAVVASALGAAHPLNDHQLSSISSSPAALGSKAGPRDITVLDLSENQIQVLIRASTLRFLVELNVSFNKLTSLASLPSSLEKLIVHHNEIERLDGVETLTRLSYLDISANLVGKFPPLGSAGAIPISVVTLLASGNAIGSTDGLYHCQQLLKLHLDGNVIKTLDELAALGGLRALRHVTIANNPVSNNPRLFSCLTASIPKLTTLDGMTLSQAQANRIVTANVSAARSRSASWARGRSSSRSRLGESSYLDPTMQSMMSGNGSRTRSNSAARDSLLFSASAIQSRSNVGRARSSLDEMDDLEEEAASIAAIEKRRDELRMKALEVRVSELRKLVSESEKKESELRRQNKNLQSQVKRTEEVLDEQDLQMDQLRAENDQLASKAESLKRTVDALDHAFRSQHANVVYTKLFTQKEILEMSSRRQRKNDPETTANHHQSHLSHREKKMQQLMATVGSGKKQREQQQPGLSDRSTNTTTGVRRKVF